MTKPVSRPQKIRRPYREDPTQFGEYKDFYFYEYRRQRCEAKEAELIAANEKIARLEAVETQSILAAERELRVANEKIAKVVEVLKSAPPQYRTEPEDQAIAILTAKADPPNLQQ